MTCRQCGEEKAAEAFTPRRGGRPLCKTCNAARTRAWREATCYRGPKRTLVCPDCGAERTYRATTSRPTPRCDPCSRKLRAAPPDARQRANARTRARRRQRAMAKSATRLFVAGSCLGCGSPFVSEFVPDGRAAARYCAQACRVRTRGRDRQERFTTRQRLMVFERDRWTCQICKRRVSRIKKWPDAGCAVVDHIVPLSATAENGGVHAAYNWQCAHKRCNAAKTDRYVQAALL